MLEITANSSRINEGTDFYDPHYLVWTLNLSEASAEAVTVEYRFLNGTALYGVDTYTGSGTLTFAAGETTREIYLRIDGDSGVELDESIVLELSDPSGAAFAGQAPVLRATSWILNDDGADEPRALFVSNPVVLEGDTGSREAVFELSLSRPAAADFEVTFATADGTALAGEDYQATTGTLTFAAGQTQASVSVPVFGDTDIEPSEGFTLTVTAPEAVAAVSAGQAQILADDAGTPTLSVIGSFSPEGTDFYDPHYLVWTLNLSEASAEAVTVEYRFLNGTALYGVDTYTGSGTLTFAAGETTREIYLRIDGDSGVELDESIVLELSDPSGAAFAGQAPVLRATSWILNDDGADEPRALFVSNPVVLEGDTGSREAVFELSLSRPAAADFEVTFATADGTALAGEDYQATTGTLTFAAGQTQASVSVPVFGDTDIEPSEGFTLTVTAPEAVAAVSAGQAQILADDAGTPTLSVIGSFSPEGTDFYDPHYLVWTLNLSEASAEAVTVEYRFLNGTALYGVDTYTGSGTLTFAAGETTREIYLRIDGDSGVELDESIVLELSDPSGAAFAGQAPVLRATSWILNDDGADEPRALFVSNPVVLEGDTGSREAVFELSLSRPAAADFEVTFATADGTALAGEDYQATTGTLTFAAGQTLASVSVPVFGDTDIEPSEGFTLTVTAPEAVAAVSAGQAQILADDAGTPTLSVIGSFSPEGTDFYDPHYLVWTLNLSEASAEAVTVEYRFLNGTALYGVDTYTGSGTLTFAAGETTREIYLRIDGDSGVELDESIVLELSDPSGAAFAGQAPVLRATSWILNDDGADEPRALFVSNPVVLEGDTGSREAVFELSLSRPAAADFEVTFATADGTALAGEDYQATTGTLTFAAGQTQASVSVPVFGDTDIEPSEGFTLTVTAPEAVAAVSAGQAQILADDAGTPTLSVIGSFSPEGTDFYDPHYLVWTLNLSEASAEAVTVEYRFLNGTALYGVDTYTGSGTLTFAAGETTREIYLRIDGDSGVELDESIVLELSDPSGAAFAGQAPVLRATSWILNDDGADEPRALFVSNPVVLEGDTGSREAVFELSLSRPAAADFEVTFATADGTALAGEDYQATTGTLTFAAGQTLASVSVPVFGDTDIEPSEGFTLTVTAPEAVAAVSAGQAQILADDAGTPTLSVIGSFSPEGTDFYDPHYLVWTLNLSEASAEAVTVEYRFLNGTALYGVDTYTGSGTLTFAAGETTREIYLRIDGDSGVELDESIVLELSDPSGAAFAGQAPVLRATSWILNDDGADEPRALFVSNPVVLEGDTGSREAVFELSLSRPAAADFEVTFATADGTALAGEDYQATTGTLTFAAGQTQASVSVPVFGDTDIEPSEGFTLTVTAPEAVAAVSGGTGEIASDDSFPPVVEDDVATVRADQILSGFNVLANDSDPEGGALTLVSVEPNGAVGTLTFLADGTITYDPGAAFADLVEGRAESENFTYVVRDDLGVTTTGSLRIDVTGAQPFELSLEMPDSLEQGIAGQATLQFNNDAPVLLAVTLERGVVADPFSGAFDTTIFVLGDGSGGLATHHLNIKGSAGPNTSVRGEVALANAAAVSDFVARFQVSQPDFLPQEAQDRVADVLAGQFGATIGDVAQALLPYDKALTSFGLGGGSAATALAFAVEEAGDFGSIAERGLQGGMGQGWSSLADLGLQMEDGFVQLTGLGDPAVLGALSADLSAIYTLSQSVGRTMLLSGTLLERDSGPRPAFQLGEDGVFRPANGFSGSLSQTETGFELRYPDGSLLSFDAAGQFLQMLGQDGSLTTANYDDNGRISALNGDNGAQLDFVYDESGRLTQVDDGTGASSEFTYDAEGRLIAATTADGSSAFGYEPLHGDLITANPAAGPNAVMSYDDQGRLTSVDLGAGLIGETIAYAPGGQITITDDAGRAVEVQLLPSGEVGRVDLGEGQAAGLDFNSTGQVIALQATDGTETTLSYDADGRVVGVTDANGAVLQFGYEGDETRPSSFTDAGGSTRSFIYDAEGRIAEAVWPDGSSLSFVYDAQGDLTGFENRRGDNTSYEYDAAGRLTFESDGSAGATSYGYDTEGRLTSTSNDHGTTTLAYNEAGQITTVGYPSGKTLNYTYNDSGLRSGLSDGNGYEVFYEYDSVGRLSGLRDGNGSIVNYGYDGSGSLLFEVNGNGTSTNYAYDALGRLEQIENRAPDDSLSSFHNYSYDNANQRTSDQSEDGTWTYGYDATGQLTSAQFASAVSGLADKSLSFEYDGAGNRTRTIEDGVETLYTVNALNQYTQVGGTSFAYDADGNMTSRSDGAGTTTYAYDIQNRLTEVRGADGTVLQFTYDVFGNRLSKVENGLTTEYLVDPFGLGNVIGEYQGGTLSGQFWHGHGLARTEVGGTLAYVDSNAVGSVTALTDATGAALNDYLYTPFGRSLLEIETLANDREFNGALGVLEDAPGLITMRARSYDAELGRFISEDPLWLTGDTENLYRFAYNNPAGFIDPAGEVPILLPVALAGAVWIGKALGVAEKAQRIQEAIQTGNPHIVENELREIVDEIGTGLYDPKNFIPPLGKLFKKLPENMQDNLSEAIKQLIGYAEPGVREAVENHREQAALNDLFDDPMQRYAPDLDNDGRPDNLEPGESYIPPVDPADPWDEDSTNTDPADASARNDGDPHLTTFDGTGYSFQAVGEFTMAIGDGFEMQTRTEAINSRVSVNTATAMTIGDHVVGIYAREDVPLVVNGTSVVLERGETLAVGEGTVYRGFFGGGGQLGNFDVYVVTDGAGNGFWVNVYYGANHLRPFVADDQNVRGLLGNLNGDRTDDFQLRDGTVLDQPLPQTVLYGAYADSWRITQEDSLFLYDEGQDTSSFSDLNFPIQITRIGDLDPTERAVAEQIARDAGLVQGSFEFETTVIDIVMTGDAVFAQLVADAPDFEEDFDPGGVTPVEINLAPIPGSDVALVAERGTVLIDVLPNDSDPEGDALLLLGGSIDAGGTVVVEDGQLHATPNVNFAGQTTLRYELGDDQGNVVEGIVVLTVDAIATRLNGTVAAETLVGGVANNEIYANGGDDRLIGNWGDDTLDGGTGIDTAVFDGPQSAFTLTLSPDRVTITDRQSVGQDTDTLTSIEFLDFDQNIDLFGDNPMDLDIFSGPAGLSAAEFGAIIELYIAYFNRAPDALGLLYWGTRYAEGHPLSEMANDFFNQDETKATYASVLDASFQLDTTDPVKVGAFVNEVYSNVLGRTPDQPGYNYWTGELTNNEDITPANFILSIIGGAKFPSNPTPQTDIDQAYLATKSDLGAYFSVIKGMSDLDDAAQSMALFDGSLASRDATLAAMDAHYADALDPETGDFLMQLVGVIDDPFEVV